jgi:hypothetical protein
MQIAQFFKRISFPFAVVTLLFLPLLTANAQATPPTATRPDHERPAFIEALLPSNEPHTMTPHSAGIVIFTDARDLSRKGTVKALIPDNIADMLLLRGGYHSEFRPGMVCRIERDGTSIAEVVVVQSTLEHSVALILNTVPKTIPRSGDTVKIKTIQL